MNFFRSIFFYPLTDLLTPLNYDSSLLIIFVHIAPSIGALYQQLKTDQMEYYRGEILLWFFLS